MTTVAQITEFASQVNKTYLMLRASGMSLQKGRRLRMGGIWQWATWNNWVRNNGELYRNQVAAAPVTYWRRRKAAIYIYIGKNNSFFLTCWTLWTCWFKTIYIDYIAPHRMTSFHFQGLAAPLLFFCYFHHAADGLKVRGQEDESAWKRRAVTRASANYVLLNFSFCNCLSNCFGFTKSGRNRKRTMVPLLSRPLRCLEEYRYPVST